MFYYNMPLICLTPMPFYMQSMSLPDLLQARLFKCVTSKLLRSPVPIRYTHAQVPALHELARAAMRLMFSGDASQWDRALQMPHYNTRSMPAISLHTGMHLIQARPPAVNKMWLIGLLQLET